MSLSVDNKKKQIRNRVRRRRQQITPDQVRAAGQQLCVNFIDLAITRSARKIACYLSFDGEISTQPLIQNLQKNNRKCYLPKLRPFKPNRLWFLPFTGQEQLIDNKHGIPEVDRPLHQAIAPSSLDIILMPLVSFDKQGNRLGMGGGYYDATLAHLRDEYKTQNRPICIGLAYECQRSEQLPTQPWDFRLNGVLTEQRYYDCGCM